MSSIPPVSAGVPSNLTVAGTDAAANTAATSKPDSTNLFGHLVQQANTDQIVSDQAITDFIQQKPGSSVQQVVMAVAEAEMSFQFFMEVRNHLIDSYNELMRMQF